MRIGELARVTGTSTSKIRYYESIGLLAAPSRRRGNQRVYGTQDVARVRFILRCRALGFTLKHVKAFAHIARANAADRKPCRDIVQGRLSSVQTQLARLREVEVRLIELLNEGAAAHKELPFHRLAVLI